MKFNYLHMIPFFLFILNSFGAYAAIDPDRAAYEAERRASRFLEENTSNQFLKVLNPASLTLSSTGVYGEDQFLLTLYSTDINVPESQRVLFQEVHGREETLQQKMNHLSARITIAENCKSAVNLYESKNKKWMDLTILNENCSDRVSLTDVSFTLIGTKLMVLVKGRVFGIEYYSLKESAQKKLTYLENQKSEMLSRQVPKVRINSLHKGYDTWYNLEE